MNEWMNLPEWVLLLHGVGFESALEKAFRFGSESINNGLGDEFLANDKARPCLLDWGLGFLGPRFGVISGHIQRVRR